MDEYETARHDALEDLRRTNGVMPARRKGRKWMNDPLASAIYDVLLKNIRTDLSDTQERMDLCEVLTHALRKKYGG